MISPGTLTRFLLLAGALQFLVAGKITAQTPVPAQPANPDQPRPAQPVAAPTTNRATATPAPPEPNMVSMTVLADSSLRNVLQALAQGWSDTQDNSPQIPLTLTNAGTMRSKIESDPSWDVVIDADAVDMKLLTDRGLLNPEGQRSLARNVVVVYGRKALLKDEDLDWFDLFGTEWKKIALGDPALVESGRVAQRALQKHDLADGDHQKMLIKAGTEAMALHVVERDQADAVFVYQSDLTDFPLRGFEVYHLDSQDAPPVFYQAALGRLAKNPDLARSFIAYCGSEPARAIWAQYGFEMN